jgi:methyltransferase
MIMEVSFALLVFVTAQRLVELAFAHRNTTRLLQEGAVEVGASHYPLIVALHTVWLGALWLWVIAGYDTFWWPAGIAYMLVQVVRLWAMSSLGRFWTTRIIVPANSKLVRRGPYRFIRHPNYCVVIAEIALLPLALGSWPMAIIFSLINAGLLTWRIRMENVTLRTRRQPA